MTPRRRPMRLFREAGFQTVTIGDLLTGDVLVDVPHLPAVTTTAAQPIGADGGLMVVGIRAWTPDGDEMASEQCLALIDAPNSPRLVAFRDLPNWRPLHRLATVDELLRRHSW